MLTCAWTCLLLCDSGSSLLLRKKLHGASSSTVSLMRPLLITPLAGAPWVPAIAHLQQLNHGNSAMPFPSARTTMNHGNQLPPSKLGNLSKESHRIPAMTSLSCSCTKRLGNYAPLQQDSCLTAFLASKSTDFCFTLSHLYPHQRWGTSISSLLRQHCGTPTSPLTPASPHPFYTSSSSSP